MKRQARKAGMIFLMMLCMGASFGCASGQNAAEFMIEQESEQRKELTKEGFSEELTQESERDIFEEEQFSFEEQIRKNEEMFFEEAEKQGIDQQTANTYLQILTEDDIFEDGAMALTGLRIADMDGNGQADLLVMVLDAKEMPFYGSGSLCTSQQKLDT